MTTRQIKKIRYYSNIDKMLNEYGPFLKCNHAFIGKKKSLEGLLLLMENIRTGEKKYRKSQGSRIDKILLLTNKLLMEINSVLIHSSFSFGGIKKEDFLKTCSN